MVSPVTPRAIKFSGDDGGRATPDPIPNSVVKPSSADGTAGVTLWESRSLPDLCPGPKGPGLFFCLALDVAALRRLELVSSSPRAKLRPLRDARPRRKRHPPSRGAPMPAWFRIGAGLVPAWCGTGAGHCLAPV